MRYIYENKNWPHFYWETDEILSLLLQLKRAQGFLLGKMEHLGFEIRNHALLQVLTENVIKSSEIEGEIFNREQVRSSVAKRLRIDQKISDLSSNYHIDGAVDVLADATQNYKEPITHERLFRWHAALFPTGYSGMFKIEVGKYKTDMHDPMQVISGYAGAEKIHYEAPNATILSAEMDNFLEYVQNNNDDDFIKAAVTHLWFLALHPFEDGNGRIARALTEIFLSRSDDCNFRFYSMCSQIMKYRHEYYDILERTQAGSMDITNWVYWFLQNLLQAIANSDVILKKVIDISLFWSKHQSINFNERQQKMLQIFLDNFRGNLTTTKWAKLCKCSQDTATRDINELLEKGILEKEGKAKNTHYVLKN